MHVCVLHPAVITELLLLATIRGKQNMRDFAKYVVLGTCKKKPMCKSGSDHSIVSEPVVRRSVPERLTSFRKKNSPESKCSIMT